MKEQLWVRLQLNGMPESHRNIAINSYDELLDWMNANKEMWQLVDIITDYSANVYKKPDMSINVRNVWYVFE